MRSCVQLVKTGHEVSTMRGSHMSALPYRLASFVPGHCRVRSWCKSGAMRINMVIRTETQRPTNLLVIINPFGGAGKARNIWRKKAEPVFLLAGKPTSGGCSPNPHMYHPARSIGFSDWHSSTMDVLLASMHMISRYVHPFWCDRVEAYLAMHVIEQHSAFLLRHQEHSCGDTEGGSCPRRS